MKIENFDYNAIILSNEERKAFDTVNEVLKNIQDRYSDMEVAHLESVITGECIDPNELARVRGILSFVHSEYFPYQIFKEVQ